MSRRGSLPPTVARLVDAHQDPPRHARTMSKSTPVRIFKPDRMLVLFIIPQLTVSNTQLFKTTLGRASKTSSAGKFTPTRGESPQPCVTGKSVFPPLETVPISNERFRHLGACNSFSFVCPSCNAVKALPTLNRDQYADTQRAARCPFHSAYVAVLLIAQTSTPLPHSPRSRH